MAGFADRIFRIKNSAPGPGIEGSRITRFRPSLVASVLFDLVCGVLSADQKCANEPIDSLEGEFVET